LTAAARSKWKSAVYGHYEISLERNASKSILVFIFTCVADLENHKPHRCAHQKTSSGTHDLRLGRDSCNKRRGVALEVSTTPTAYSESTHRALIVLHCAKYHRPLNMVLDDEYKQEVELL